MTRRHASIICPGERVVIRPRRPNTPSSGAEVLSPSTDTDGVADAMIEALVRILETRTRQAQRIRRATL
jgi:hypothetical protein